MLVLQKLLDILRTNQKADVRATYGPEPYRSAAEVSIAERATSVLDGSAKFLLREVIGLEEFRKVPETFIPKRFARELPLTADQLERHVYEHGLPEGFGGMEIQHEFAAWHLVVFDRKPEIRGIYASKSEAQLAAVRLCSQALQPYIHGRLHDL